VKLLWVAAMLIAQTVGIFSKDLDDRSLWTSTVSVCPGSAKAHYNLGNVTKELPGRLPDAVAQYETALRIRPNPRLREMVNRLRAGLK
jgi:hypothetical protein